MIRRDTTSSETYVGCNSLFLSILISSGSSFFLFCLSTDQSLIYKFALFSADLVMWRDVPKSAIVFGLGMLIIVSSYMSDNNTW